MSAVLRPVAALLALVVLSASPASAVEIPGTVVDAPAIAPARVDHSEAWATYLRAQRAERIADLRVYSDNGEFPIGAVPGFSHQFLDANGTPCAVASLIMTSGHADLVRNMAATNNAVVVSELNQGPIVDWVLTSGLTMEEIAVIQVPGFREEIVLREPIEVQPDKQKNREIRRIRRHLSATLELLDADHGSSIDKAVQRLGDLRFQVPPSEAVALVEPVPTQGLVGWMRR